MRLADLIGADVFDAAGEKAGTVHDARLSKQPDPAAPGNTIGTIRLEQLVLRPSSIGARLGYAHREMRGPLLLARALRSLARKATIVAWEDITAIEPGRITIGVSARALPTLAEVEDLR
jgi:hypothetical protein